MKARYWKSWERYVPAKEGSRRASSPSDCLKPWEQLFPSEGVEEVMSPQVEPWRAWEKYLPPIARNMGDESSSQMLDVPEKIKA